jgi:hypothetical protein
VTQRILLERDARRSLFYEKDTDGRIGVRTVWNNNDDHLRASHDLRKDTPLGFKGTKEGDAHYVAHIPDAVIPQLVALGIAMPGGRIIDKTKLMRWLSKSEQAPFRIKRGRLG